MRLRLRFTCLGFDTNTNYCLLSLYISYFGSLKRRIAIAVVFFNLLFVLSFPTYAVKDAIGVNGTIPIEISALSSLEKFQCVSGDLHGTLPTEMGDKLSRLQTVRIYHTQLSVSVKCVCVFCFHSFLVFAAF